MTNTKQDTSNKTKGSFLLHKDSLNILNELTDEQAGILFKAIYEYQLTGELPKLDFAIKMALLPFINQFKREDEKYYEVVEKRRKAGIESGEQRRAKRTSVQCVEQNEHNRTKRTDSDNVNDSDNDNDSDNENDCIAMQCNSFKNEKGLSKILKPEDEDLTLEAFMDICNKNKKYIDGENALKKWEEKYNTFKANRNNDKSETASLTWQNYLTNHWLTHEWEMKTLKQGQEPVKVKTQKEKEEELKKIELNEKITAENLSILNDYCKNFLSYREKVEDSIRRQFGDAIFDSWFSTFKIAVENLTLCFFVEKEKYKNAILIHYSTKLERVLERVIKEEIGYKDLKVMSYAEFR